MYRSDPTTSHKSQNHLSERKVVPHIPTGITEQKAAAPGKARLSWADAPRRLGFPPDPGVDGEVAAVAHIPGARSPPVHLHQAGLN